MEKPQEERWKVIEIEEAVRRWRGDCLTPRAAMELIEQHLIPAELLSDLFNNYSKVRRAGARVKFRNKFFWAVSEELTSLIYRAEDRFS